jgi:hypothetical protein
MAAEPRRIWGGVVLPAQLHESLVDHAGHRRMNAVVVRALQALLDVSDVPSCPRPCRQRGCLSVTLRLPVTVADRVDRWTRQHGVSRQAAVEYALVKLLESGG